MVPGLHVMRFRTFLRLALVCCCSLSPLLAASPQHKGKKSSVARTSRRGSGTLPAKSAKAKKNAKSGKAPAQGKSSAPKSGEEPGREPGWTPPAKTAPELVGVKVKLPVPGAEVLSPYKAFLAALDEQVRSNALDFCPAATVVLDATGDELAMRDWMDRAAREGQVAAMQYVGNLSLRNVAEDQLQSSVVKKAFGMVEKSAAAGFAPAQINKYMCMNLGMGTPKDAEGARKFMAECCKNGDFIPRYKWLEISGRLNTYQDKERPEVKSEIDRGNYHVLYVLARRAENPDQQRELLTQAARLGSSESLLMLSMLSAREHPRESFVLLKEAARQHNAEAMFTLGSALADPDPSNASIREAGIQKNETEGVRLIKTASMMGDTAAHYWLANSYYDGAFGQPRDENRAYRHFEEGYLSGNVACASATAFMMIRGVGCQPNVEEGLALLQRSANVGYPYAVILMANVQYNGIGVPADGRAAAAKLREVGALNSPAAYVYLAYILTKGGNNLPADPDSARHYLRLAKSAMGDKAQQMFDALTEKGAWDARPCP